MRNRYPLTKMIQIFAARYLAMLAPVERTGVAVNCLDPGLCYTNLNSHVGDAVKKMVNDEREKYFGRTAEMGSRTLLGSAALGKESHGLFTGSCEIKEYVQFCLDLF